MSQSPAAILRELKKLPKKFLGQNFLVDGQVTAAMIGVAAIGPDETIVEIGPGLGALTWEMAKVAKQVLAIEADQELVNYLRLKKRRNVKIIHGDGLKVDWTIGLTGTYKIVANIPYSITSPLLRKIFLLKNPPAAVVLLVQKEVAQRLTAPEGSSERGFLTILTEANAQVKKIRSVYPGSFYPRPRTDSAVISLNLLARSQAKRIFWPAVEAGFRHKRQTLVNSLVRDLKIPKK
ncbi:MAG: 16S rRNA (adenine(1518)-N(6)/adenine(1519)-N(6))-dimethyltransferase RsmA, partial [Patescibacteria group bacterium]